MAAPDVLPRFDRSATLVGADGGLPYVMGHVPACAGATALDELGEAARTLVCSPSSPSPGTPTLVAACAGTELELSQRSVGIAHEAAIAAGQLRLGLRGDHPWSSTGARLTSASVALKCSAGPLGVPLSCSLELDALRRTAAPSVAVAMQNGRLRAGIGATMGVADVGGGGAGALRRYSATLEVSPSATGCKQAAAAPSGLLTLGVEGFGAAAPSSFSVSALAPPLKLGRQVAQRGIARHGHKGASRAMEGRGHDGNGA